MSNTLIFSKFPYPLLYVYTLFVHAYSRGSSGSRKDQGRTVLQRRRRGYGTLHTCVVNEWICRLRRSGFTCTYAVPIITKRISYMQKFLPEENFANFTYACRWRKKIFLRIFSYVHTCVCTILRPHRVLCISCISIGPHTTSWRVAHVVGKIKFGKIFVTIQSMNHWRNF